MLAALYETPAPARWPLSYLAFMIGIFVIGISIGLAGAWWMASSSGKGMAAPFEQPVPGLKASSPKLRQLQSIGATKGVSQGELPYDGASVEQVDRKPVTATANQDELPYGGLYSESSAPAQKGVPTVMQPAETAATQASAGEKKTIKASQRRRTVQRASKDREIERIRQQAAEELKKKTENRQALGAHANSRPSSRQTARQEAPPVSQGGMSRTRTLLARCEHAANFILREQCKWQLCGGMWGKNGCPSYTQHGSFY